MTDRQAMLALARPEPDYFDEPVGWQLWHDRRIEALAHARGIELLDETVVNQATAETACPWPVRA